MYTKEYKEMPTAFCSLYTIVPHVLYLIGTQQVICYTPAFLHGQWVELLSSETVIATYELELINILNILYLMKEL